MGIGFRGGGLADEPKIPKVVADASALSSLRLSAVEGFILSRIDGQAAENELAALTGLSEAQVRSTLDKLEALGVVAKITRRPPPASGAAKAVSTTNRPLMVPPSPSQAAPPPVSGEVVAASAKDASSVSTPTAKRVLRSMAAIPPDAPELSEDVDLPPPLRLRVLGTSAVLDSLDYYEMLGVERTADKKALKSAYFALAAVFHPDRY